MPYLHHDESISTSQETTPLIARRSRSLTSLLLSRVLPSRPPTSVSSTPTPFSTAPTTPQTATGDLPEEPLAPVPHEHPDGRLAGGPQTSHGLRAELYHWANAVAPLSLTLENNGNVARDHLASECTFLTYVQTSLTIASAGVGEPLPRSRYHVADRLRTPHIALAQILNSAPSDSSSQLVSSRHVRSYARPLAATAICIALVVLLIGKIASYHTACEHSHRNGLRDENI